MEKDNTLHVHRARSFQAIIRDGYRLYIQNFWKLLRSSWIWAVIYALVTGFSMSYFFCKLLPLLMSHSPATTEWLIWLASLVGFVLVAILFAFAGGIAPLKEHEQTAIISKPRHWWGLWPWKLTLRGLTRLPRMLLQTIRHGHLAMLIAVLLMVALIILVASILFELPAFILGIADVEAQKGYAHGDAVDMPEHLYRMNFLTFTFCGFVQAFIHLSSLFPLYYLWGSKTTEKK